MRNTHRVFIYLIVCIFLTLQYLYAQNTIYIKIYDRESGDVLSGANIVIAGTLRGASSDERGVAFLQNLPDGQHTLIISYIGYDEEKEIISLALVNADSINIYLRPIYDEFDAISVTTTRSSRMIKDIPTRIELISSEELEENAVMNSANVAQLLRETTGIHVQQTSQNSMNMGIRIHGLDGKYTQILKDGFPLYGGFSNSLSIMQIPPLDLKQVEVIKGSHSTLYGGGAIAGIINLISKEPESEPELSLMFNQTSSLGSTINSYLSGRKDKIGYTLYASANYQKPYDPDHDNFSNIPKTKGLGINSSLHYFLDDMTKFRFNLNTGFDERYGGDMKSIRGETNEIYTYSEKNLSNRYSTQLVFEKEFADQKQLTFKNSVNYFRQSIKIPNYKFEGKQWSSFTEIAFSFQNEDSEWVFGTNILFDYFDENNLSTSFERDYEDFTVGFFAQNTNRVNKLLTLEMGLRSDYNVDYGTFILPRVSMLFSISNNLSSRWGFGLGYKIPNMFTDDAEKILFQNIYPLDKDQISSENSIGSTFDVNYTSIVSEKSALSINQLFFYTQLKNSLELGSQEQQDLFFFKNRAAVVRSIGFETNIKFTYSDYALYLNYAFINAKLIDGNQKKQKPVTPKHTIGSSLLYEALEEWRAGFEMYYIGPQILSDNTKTDDYWMFGFMIMREMEQFSIFLNFENFTDTRQSNFGPTVLPPFNNPEFTEIWAPIEGFVANAGIKIDLW
jgi:outer membrane receptor for ferrienterochelin and colicins